jgi:hypothetical protein
MAVFITYCFQGRFEESDLYFRALLKKSPLSNTKTKSSSHERFVTQFLSFIFGCLVDPFLETVTTGDIMLLRGVVPLLPPHSCQPCLSDVSRFRLHMLLGNRLHILGAPFPMIRVHWQLSVDHLRTLQDQTIMHYESILVHNALTLPLFMSSDSARTRWRKDVISRLALLPETRAISGHNSSSMADIEQYLDVDFTTMNLFFTSSLSDCLGPFGETALASDAGPSTRQMMEYLEKVLLKIAPNYFFVSKHIRGYPKWAKSDGSARVLKKWEGALKEIVRGRGIEYVMKQQRHPGLPTVEEMARDPRIRLTLVLGDGNDLFQIRATAGDFHLSFCASVLLK